MPYKYTSQYFKNNRITRNPIILKNIGISLSLYIYPHQSQTTLLWKYGIVRAINAYPSYWFISQNAREKRDNLAPCVSVGTKQRLDMRSARRRKRLFGRVNRSEFAIRGGRACLGVCVERGVYPFPVWASLHKWQFNIDANLAFISNCCPPICVFTTIKLRFQAQKAVFQSEL